MQPSSRTLASGSLGADAGAADHLALYIRTVWLVQHAALCAVRAPFASAEEQLLWACAALAVCRPSLLTVVVATALGNALRLKRWPVQWDSEVWSLLLDTTLLLACARAWRGLPTAERNAAFGWFARIARFQLACFYFGAFFWKLNTSFLEPRTSCAPIFFYQLIAAYVPHGWLGASSPLALAIGLAAPVNTLAVEVAIPALILQSGVGARRLALGVALAFHALIALTPPPNNASGFSLTVAKYLFVVLELPAALAARDALSPAFWLSGAAAIVRSAALVGALACATQIGLHAEHVDWFVPAYALAAVVLLRALQLAGRPHVAAAAVAEPERESAPPCAAHARGWCACGALVRLLAVGYALCGPLTGLMDQQSTNMYANLKIHAGSNHLLLPTGLALGSRLLPGGLVRVVGSSSAHITAMYPAEITELISPRAREFLRALGHSGRQFNAMKRRILGPGATPPDHTRAAALRGAPLAVPYTLPAIELRRLLLEARAANESFRLSYQHLPGMRGDEVWRQTAAGPTVRFSEDRATGTSACTVLVTPAGPYLPCAPDELALLPPAPWWVHKLVMLQPYPILPPGERWTEVHCFGP